VIVPATQIAATIDERQPPGTRYPRFGSYLGDRAAYLRAESQAIEADMQRLVGTLRAARIGVGQ
jgi:hypothetical protein